MTQYHPRSPVSLNDFHVTGNLSKQRVMKLMLLLFILLPLSVLIGCEAPDKSIDFPSLVVTPEAILIANPAPGEAVAQASVVLQNVSSFDVTLLSIVLREEDDSPELRLADALTLSQEMTIPSNGSKTITLLWESQDEQADRAQLVLQSTAGEQVFQVETEVPYAGLEISVTPAPETFQGERRIRLRTTPPGELGRAVITIRSMGVSPLIISETCLSMDGTGCMSELDLFRLCDGANATPDTCQSPNLTSPLLLGQERKLSMIYEPSFEQLRMSSAKFTMRSNAHEQEEVSFLIQGKPCVPIEGEDGCASFHYTERSSLTLGVRTMKSTSGSTLRGHLNISGHLSQDTKQQLHLKGRLTP